VNLCRGQKVKVTRPINVHTVNAQYLPNGKAYEFQTMYTDGIRRPASATNKVKVARSCDASDRCWTISREQNVIETPKLVLGRKVVHPTVNNAHQFQGQGHQAD